MFFKIDENLPSELASRLVETGHDALTVYDQKLEGKPDEIVSVVCKSEDRNW
jgi:hypothetical protein